MKHIVVYDAGCGPCTRFRRIVGLLDVKRRLDFESLLDADGRGHLDSVQQSLRHRSFHLISPDGGVASGARALPDLLALLPACWPASGAIRSSDLVFHGVEFVYSVFSRLHDSGSCSYERGRRQLIAGTGGDDLAVGALQDRVNVDIDVDTVLPLAADHLVGQSSFVPTFGTD